MISDVRFPSGPASFAAAPTGGASAVPSTNANVASAASDITGSLRLTTKEGDTFTLSASVDTALTYSGAGRDGAGASTVSAETRRSLTVSVQGDLNAQEMRDIARYVRRFLHDLRDAAGGGNASLANLARGDGSSLQSLTASIETHTDVTLASAGTRPDVAPMPVAPPHAEGAGGPAAADPRGDFHTRQGGNDHDGDDGGAATPLLRRGFVRPAPTPVPVSTPPIVDALKAAAA